MLQQAKMQSLEKTVCKGIITEVREKIEEGLQTIYFYKLLSFNIESVAKVSPKLSKNCS